MKSLKKYFHHPSNSTDYRMSFRQIYQQITKPTIHFVHCIEFRNQGDMNCCPYFYFKDYFNRYPCFIHNIWDINHNVIHCQDIVIIGGGGMLDCLDKFQDVINKLTYTCQNCISWGLGHNQHEDRTVYWPIDYSRFKLLSVRDYNHHNQPYCPDVSCLMKGLENTYPIKREIGLISHQDFPIDLPFENITHKEPIDTILTFIGNSDIIITNTYHCAYWAMCMNKKVILYQPFSTKFHHFKHQPVIYSGDLENDIAAAYQYPHFLSECRQLNYSFFEHVKNIIEEQHHVNQQQNTGI